MQNQNCLNFYVYFFMDICSDLLFGSSFTVNDLVYSQANQFAHLAHCLALQHKLNIVRSLNISDQKGLMNTPIIQYMFGENSLNSELRIWRHRKPRKTNRWKGTNNEELLLWKISPCATAIKTPDFSIGTFPVFRKAVSVHQSPNKLWVGPQHAKIKRMRKSAATRTRVAEREVGGDYPLPASQSPRVGGRLSSHSQRWGLEYTSTTLDAGQLEYLYWKWVTHTTHMLQNVRGKFARQHLSTMLEHVWNLQDSLSKGCKFQPCYCQCVVNLGKSIPLHASGISKHIVSLIK